MSTQQESAGAAARSAQDHPALEWPARAGLFAYGVVYLIVAWLGAQLAIGEREGSASGEGALREVAQQPLGVVALWFAAAGFAALTVWQACRAVGGHRSKDGIRLWAARAGSAGRGVVYAVLGALAVRTATGGSGGGGGDKTGGVTADLMRQPLGSALVVAVGIGIIGLGAFSVYKAVTDRWRKGLDPVPGTVAALARTGYVGRGVSFFGIGGLFVWAGLTHDPRKSGGLDQAIVRFRDEPYGPYVMVVVVAGLACYGAFHMVRAFYLRSGS